MIGNATIGALRVALGLDSAEFVEGLKGAQAQLRKAGREIERLGSSITTAGAVMTAAFTTSFVLLGKGALDAAAGVREAQGQVNAALASMGGASGKTAEQLKAAAAQLQSLSTFDDDDILRKVTANLLTFGNVAGQAFDRAQQAAVDLSARLGQDLQSSAIQVGKALNDPIKGVTALQRVGVSFTEAQKEQIKALTETGQAAQAQSIILAELERQFAGSAKALRDATPGADAIDAWRDFQETLGAILAKVLPPLTQALTAILDTFNKLSPSVQTGVVAFAAVLAGLGPLTVAIGAVVTGLGAMTSAFAAGGVAATGFGAAVRIAMGPVGIITGLLTAATVALGAFIVTSQKANTAAGATAETVGKRLAEARARLADLQDGAILEKGPGRTGYRQRTLSTAGGRAGSELSREKARVAAEVRELEAQMAALEKKARASAEAREVEAQLARQQQENAKTLANLASHTDTATKASRARAPALSDEQKAQDQLKRSLDAYIEDLQTLVGNQGLSAEDARIKEVQARANEAFTAGLYDQGLALTKLAGQLIQQRDLNDSIIDQGAALKQTPQDMSEAWADAVASMRTGSDQLYEALQRVRYSIEDIAYAVKSGDWMNAVRSVGNLVGGIGAAFKSGGLAGGFSAVGQVAGSVIGGRAGQALATGASIAGAGVWAGGALSSGVLATLGATGGFLSSAGLALSGLLGPIGIIAGVAVALNGIFGPKPTNAGAGVALSPDRILGLSGDKRTKETEQAATTAANAILQGEDFLRQAGITLGATVSGLVLGTRDLSQIYLTNGQTLTAAVGDASAAVETALKALLDGATFASEAQEKLVDSMLAAGEGFDAISEALTGYAAAQGLSQAVLDQILQLTDPQAFEKAQLGLAQAARRTEAKTALDAGYLTSAQFDKLSADLDKLDALELDALLKRFGDSADEAAAAADALSAAQDDLRAAYDAEASALQDTIAELSQAAEGLRAFRDELTRGALAGLSPEKQLASARAEFQRLAGLSAADPQRLAGLEAVGRALVESARVQSPDDLTFRRELARVRNAVSESADAAQTGADLASQQLSALQTQVGQLVQLNQNVLSVAQAIANLKIAQAAVTPAANDNSRFADYLLANPDVRDAAFNTDFGRSFASPEAYGQWHWQNFGQSEGRTLPGFATGGAIKVGGMGGIDSQLTQFWASPGEYSVVSHVDPMATVAGLSAELAAQRQENAAGLYAIARNTRMTEKLLKKWDLTGQPEQRDLSVGV